MTISFMTRSNCTDCSLDSVVELLGRGTHDLGKLAFGYINFEAVMSHFACVAALFSCTGNFHVTILPCYFEILTAGRNGC